MNIFGRREPGTDAVSAPSASTCLACQRTGTARHMVDVAGLGPVEMCVNVEACQSAWPADTPGKPGWRSAAGMPDPLYGNGHAG